MSLRSVNQPGTEPLWLTTRADLDNTPDGTVIVAGFDADLPEQVAEKSGDLWWRPMYEEPVQVGLLLPAKVLMMPGFNDDLAAP